MPDPQEKREETAEAYAQHVPENTPPPKPPMGSQAAKPGEPDKIAEAAHAADAAERSADHAHRFPGIDQEALDSRANFSRKQMVLDAAIGNEKQHQTMARLRAEAEAAKERAAKGGNIPAVVNHTEPGRDDTQHTGHYGRLPGARKEYTCGCVATHPDPNAQLPADCPTHSIPVSEHKEPVKPSTLEEIKAAGYSDEVAHAILDDEQRAFSTGEKPYGPNGRRMPSQWPPQPENKEAV